MMEHREQYIPALGLDWLTPFYDPLLKRLFPEEQIKYQLVRQAHLQANDVVLDLGCGTATLTILLKQRHPHTSVMGLDGDRRILSIASDKIDTNMVTIPLIQATALHVPFADQSFTRIVSSLVFHHLTHTQKQQALLETLRILQPGGELHIADFGEPHTSLAQLLGLGTRYFEQMHDHVTGAFLEMLAHVGFEDIVEHIHIMTVLGTITLLSARKPNLLD